MESFNPIFNEIKQLTQRLTQKYPGMRVYLYGSRARGDHSENSDWDLLIVKDGPKSSNDDFEKYAFPFAEIGWMYGEQITPLLYSKNEWEAQRYTSFYNNVNTDAILL